MSKDKALGQSAAMRDDMRALAVDNSMTKTLPSLAPVGKIPSRTGRVDWSRSAGLAGSGLASPLTEIDAGAGNSSREYYDDKDVYFFSSDYLLAVEIKPLKTLRMVDADGSAATFEFKLPPPSEEP